MDLDGVRVLNRELQDYTHGNVDEGVLVAFRTGDKVDNTVAVAAVVAVVVAVVVVVVRKQRHCSHDRKDMHLPTRSNLYFQKNHYMAFF